MIINQIGKKNDISIPTPDVDANSGNIADGKVGYARTGKVVGTVPVKVDHKIMSYTYSEDDLPDIIDIGYFKGRYIAICKIVATQTSKGTLIAISKDGNTWEKQWLSGIVQKIYVGSNTVLLTSGTTTWIYDGNDFTNVSYSIGGVAFGDAIFMSMSLSGDIYTHEDSKSFTDTTKTSLDSNYTWKKICYGGCNGGVFVALPEKKNSASNNVTNIIQYSLDKGTTWKNASITSYIYQDICYGNGMFILIPYSTAANAELKYYYMSYNGVSWSRRTLPVAGFWNKIIYLNGKFHLYGLTTATSITVGDKFQSMMGSIIGGEGSSAMMSIPLCSSDGINWELDLGRLKEQPDLACMGVDSYIISYANEYKVSTMHDGDCDKDAELAYTIQLPDPDKTGDYIILRTEDDKKLYIRNKIGEPTTVNAEVQNYGDTDTIRRYFGAIFYGNGIFILLPWYQASDSSSTAITNMSIGAYSLDGIIWQKMNVSAACEFIAGCYGNGTYVAIGNSVDNTEGETSATNKAAYSSTGISAWTSMSLPAVQYWSDVCYGNGMFVAVASAISDNSNNDVCAAISYNGTSWTKVVKNTKTNVDLNFEWVCYGNGKFVAIRPDACCYSNDGVEWHKAPLSATKLSNITFGNGIFAIITTDAMVYYSTNLYDWECTDTGATSKSGSTTAAKNIVFGNGKFIAGNKYSYDCKTWKTYSGISISNDYVSSPVCYGNGRFVKFGEYCVDKTEVLNYIPLSGGYMPG